MKCIIEKASWTDGHSWDGKYSDDNVAPCEGAYQGEDSRWYIDIDSMDHLKDLVKEVDYGIILSGSNPKIDDDDYLRLTIYDQYIE